MKNILLAVMLVAAQLLVATSSMAATKCAAERDIVRLTYRDLRSAQRELSSEYRARSRDERYYGNLYRRVDRQFRRIDAKLNYLQSRQWGDPITDLLTFSPDPQKYAEIAARIEALQGEKFELSNERAQVLAEAAQVRADHDVNVAALEAELNSKYADYKASVAAYGACAKAK